MKISSAFVQKVIFNPFSPFISRIVYHHFSSIPSFGSSAEQTLDTSPLSHFVFACTMLWPIFPSILQMEPDNMPPFVFGEVKGEKQGE